jgi:signal transduction histidine kinase/ligand-binding sensor domain-containing protein
MRRGSRHLANTIFSMKTEASKVLLLRCVQLCFLLLSAVSTLLAVDPTFRISQYAHTAWRIQDGFLKGATSSVTQTPDGYLWIATEAGLVRFDGVRFVPWAPPGGEQLPSSSITALLAARDGSLWIGTEDGLSHWINKRLVNYPAWRARINSIIEDHNGTIWAARSRIYFDEGSPLCRVIGTEMQCDSMPKKTFQDSGGGSVLVEDSFGDIWMGGTTALTRWKSDALKVFKVNGLKSSQYQGGVQGLAANHDGSLWVGMAWRGHGLGLEQLIHGSLRPFITSKIDGSRLEIENLFMDRENALWIATFQDGIYRLHDRTVDHFSTADGLSSEHAFNFFEDREGDLWVATSKGLDRFRDFRIVSFSPTEGLGTTEVDSVFATSTDVLWVGGYNTLDALRQRNGFQVHHEVGLPGKQVTSLFEDHTGQMWVGIDNTLTIYKDGTFKRIDTPDGRPIGMVAGITEDTEGNLWIETIGLPRTLFRIRGRRVREELPAPEVSAGRKVAADPKGGIWIGLLNGDLARILHGRMETFHFEHRLDSKVDQVLVSSDGTVFGATAFGLIAWRNGKQQILTSHNGLPCDSVRALVLDQRGALWLYMQYGLVEIEATELQKWFEHPDSKLGLRVFDELDGLQPGWAPFNGATRTQDGRLWFANGHLLQMIDPAHLARNDVRPPVQIEAVVADTKSYVPQTNLKLPPRTHDLEIDYTALSFVVPQKVRFRYQLEGHDSEWQDPGTRRQAFYGDLHPGHYKFRVIASNNDGVWNQDGAILDFDVVPAWYQTNWFRASFVGAFVLLLWALYQVRLRQLTRQFARELETRIDERTRIARDLHDTLLQSFHGLMLRFQAASNLFITRPTEAKRTLESAIDEAAQAITEGRDAIQALRSSPVETNDLVSAIKALGEELADSGTSDGSAAFHIDVAGTPRALRSVVRDEIYWIACETLRNAFRHANAHRIAVAIQYDDRHFSLHVRDDGKGFDHKALREAARTGHFGLDGMSERARLVGAQLELWSEVGSGAEIELSLPAAIAYTQPPASLRSWRSKIFSGKRTGMKL